MKAFTPIIELSMNPNWTFDLELLDCFTDEEQGSDDFTYTMRVSIMDENRRATIRSDLQAYAGDDEERLVEVRQLISLLDEHDWDVSFFVDCW